MKFEDILHKIGDEHRFQKFLIVFLLLPTSFFNVYFEGLLLLSTPDHWCRVPELEHLPFEKQHLMIRPIDSMTGKPSTCQRFKNINFNYNNNSNNNVSNSTDTNQSFNDNGNQTELMDCKDGWIFDKSLYTETAVTWFNFICGRDYYVNMILSITSIGLAVMTPLLSHLSDRIGRRKALFVTLILSQITCLSPIILKDIYSFVVARFLAGGILNVYYQLPFVLTQELVSQNYRTKASCLSSIFYSLGCIFATQALKLAGDWVTFTWIPFLLTSSIFLGFKWIPESPTWLISKKRYDEAYKELVDICRFNKRPIPENLMKDIMSVETEEKDSSDDPFIDLVILPGLRSKTFFITCVYLGCVIGYSGILSNTANMEASNQLHTYLVLSLVDLPSSFICWKLINTPLGRRWTTVIAFFVSGIGLMLPSLYPGYDQTFYLICTIIGKFGVAGTFMIVFQHSSELYPTTLRNQGLGLTATLGSIGGVIAPQIAYIAKYGAWIPLFIMGVICILSAICASFLPETLNEYLPQRSKEAAIFGSDKPFWVLADTKKNNKTEVDKKDEDHHGEGLESTIN